MNFLPSKVAYESVEHIMSTLIIGVSGVRGIIDDGLDDKAVQRLARAYADIIGPAKRIILARDSRPSGQKFAQTVASALTRMGLDVTDLAIVSTPGAALMTVKQAAAGAVVITASHNPSQWNGLKFLGPDGLGLSAQDMAKLSQTFHDESVKFTDAQSKGQTQSEQHTHQIHTQEVLQHVDVQAIRARKFRVVLDSVNGAGGPGAKLLLEKLGCDLVHINAEPTGIFPHAPEPLAENLTGLCQTVSENNADVGFAQDPDADRLVVVDEQGQFIGEEYTLVLAVMNVLEKAPGPVATNLSTSRMIDDLAQKFGVKVIRTPVGEVHVARAMRQYNCVIGGEGNGGVINPQVISVRDSFSGIALTLDLLAKTGKSISQLIKQIPSYCMLKTKFPCQPDRAKKILDLAAKTFAQQKPNCSDGVRIDWPEGWVHVRSSNTEPIMRVFAEAADIATAEQLIKRVTRIAEETS